MQDTTTYRDAVDSAERHVQEVISTFDATKNRLHKQDHRQQGRRVGCGPYGWCCRRRGRDCMKHRPEAACILPCFAGAACRPRGWECWMQHGAFHRRYCLHPAGSRDVRRGEGDCQCSIVLPKPRQSSPERFEHGAYCGRRFLPQSDVAAFGWDAPPELVCQRKFNRRDNVRFGCSASRSSFAG